MGAKGTKCNPQTVAELRRHVLVEFSEDDIKGWYIEYQNSLQKGQRALTKKEFVKVYNTLFAGDASEFAEHVFRTFDTDGNGSVDFKEFIVGLCMSGSSNYETKLKWAFRMYDINNDGYICREEMHHIICAIYKMINAHVTEVNSPDKMTEAFFAELDNNNDGKISWEEFCSGAARDPTIVHFLECDPQPD